MDTLSKMWQVIQFAEIPSNFGKISGNHLEQASFVIREAIAGCVQRVPPWLCRRPPATGEGKSAAELKGEERQPHCFFSIALHRCTLWCLSEYNAGPLRSLPLHNDLWVRVSAVPGCSSMYAVGKCCRQQDSSG